MIAIGSSQGGVVTTRGIRGMEERRGLETGGATESWTVELGAGRLVPTLGRDGVNNVPS